MKRAFAILAGLATVGVGVYLGSRLLAQPSAPPAQPTAGPLRTRVALVNMLQVLKHYKKAQTAEASLKAQVQQMDKDFEPKRAEVARLRTDYGKATDPAAKEQIERQVRKLQIETNEMEEDNRKRLGKQQGEIAVQIYREVEDMVKLFAKVNDIELVFHYNDASREVQGADFYSPANVQRKLMMIGPVMPLYHDPRMDITPAVIQMLNERIPGGAAPGG